MTTNIFLDRFLSNRYGTFGVLAVPLIYSCYTLEPPERYKFSYLVEGTYPLIQLPREGKAGSWFLLDTTGTGRTGILIHAGNTEVDTKGCILVGQSMNLTHSRIERSRVCLTELNQTLKDLNKTTKLMITITNKF